MDEEKGEKMFLVGQRVLRKPAITERCAAATALWRSQPFGIRLRLALDE